MRENTVRLGLMPPLTGLVEMYGAEITRAGLIACDEINENGGVLGRPLELVIEDDGSLPESAVAAALKLVDQHRCTAIVGNLLSNSRIAVAYQVAEPRRIPYLNFSFYEGSILSRYFFHFAALPNQQIDRMIPYMRQRYGPRMFFAGNNYEWPRGSIDAAKHALEQAGGQILGEEYCPIGASDEDIERLLDHVAESGADVFVPYFAGADQIHLLTRFTERGLKSRMAVVMGHYDEIMASRLPPEVREGFYSSNTYFMTLDTPENREYLARLAKQPGVDGIWPQGNGILTNFGEGAYLCVKAFAKAANLAGNLDPEALVNALETITVTGPQGTAQMDPETHHARVNTCLSRCEAGGSFAIIEKFGAIPPVLPERYRHLRISKQSALEDIYLQSRMMAQITEAVLLVHAADDAIVYANPGAERMFAYGSGELGGKRFSVLFAPSGKSPEEFTASIGETLSQKGVWQGETENITQDGRRFWCATSISAFTHPRHGEVWMVMDKDISERKQAEETLRSSEQRFRKLIKVAPIPMCYVSKGGVIQDFNDRFAHVFGYTHEEIPTLEKWWQLAYPDATYRERVLATWNAAVQAATESGQDIQPVEYNVTCRNGDVRIMEISGVILGEDFLATFIDKQAEWQLRERIKELRAFYSLTDLIEQKGITPDSLCQELTNILPQSWQYPEITCARIVTREGEFHTGNFRESEWMLTAPLKMHGSVIGKIEVGYLEQKPTRDEGPFLKEERQLINAIAERVGHIIERMHAEEELHSASLYTRSLIESSPDPLVTISAEGKITDVNEATVEVTGVPRRMLIGSDFSNYFTEPDRARAGYQEVFAKGFVSDFPLTLRHVSGKLREVLYNASVYRNEKGEVAGVFAAARDVTERKRAEEELRAALLYARSLIEASLDPLVTISAEGKITDVNESTVEATGVPRRLMIGSDFSDYFTEPDKARAGYQEVFAKGYVTDYPLSLRHVSGKVTDVLYNATVYRDEKGGVAGVFAAARDITERKRAEDELRQYREHLEELVQERTSQLEAANKDLESFAYSVSHDLRVPLRAIDGFSRLVLKQYEEKLDDEGKRLLNVVRDNTRRMGQLIDDILAFSRAGRLELKASKIDTEAVVREVWQEFEPSLAGRELRLEVKPLPEAQGDPAMLRQVFVNLLGNAVKFTAPRAAARIEVGCMTEGNEHVFYVKDNGVGFEQQYVDKLFGVFQRLHGIEEFEGTGIGLAIVKRIVTRHGGRVWAEGKLNEGAAFYFTLPA